MSRSSKGSKRPTSGKPKTKKSLPAVRPGGAEAPDEITGYPQIDILANDLLPLLSPRDQAAIRGRLKKNAELYRKRHMQIGDHRSLLHPLGELRMGAILVGYRCAIEYEKEFKVQINDKDEDRTPDWTVYSNSGEISCILDLANFHGDGRYEEAFLGGSPAPSPKPEDVLGKLYTAMEDKCLRYRELADQLNKPLVVAVYLHFTVWDGFEPNNVRDLCCVGADGLFYRFPEVSGFLHFAEGGPKVIYYEKNPKALRDLDIPGGLL
jgi:hypothetical protein